ncbi:deleted in malignant brain tumors 1 protein-like isoform X2 [Acanthaster planci]|uniref:Deleted in malignant brain tumors 1 protein-like isoform X2 n=1 Tax=Acanthaster planci TaxID=133434 RepID=A0A8B7XNB6_ACAPL|nr:deleted in malignant brain tumors 1 protein-like isoform X2 [Acanthaster planci]
MRKPCNRLMLVRIIGSTMVTVTLFNFTYASQLRLVAGRTSSQGRLEIYVNGEWGTVCDDSWGLVDAHVACRQLGFPAGAVKATSGGFYPGGTGPIHLDDVDCRGYERDLVDCDHRGIGSHNCGHGEDAGVLCNTGVRLVGSSSSMDGRVEVLWNGAWGTVCDDLWDLNDATVVCRQLGFLGAWEASTSATFGAGDGLDIVLDDVACTGNEGTLLDCGHAGLGEHNCGHSEDAGVRCVDMRLVDGDTINEGRLELLLNDEWGTVCDDSWGQEEAQVACRQLGFPSAIEATSRASFGIGVGSIHLDNVECTGSESNLLSCQHNEIGENDCGHGEDAGVICNPDKLRLVGGANIKEGRLEIFLNGEWGTVCDDSWDIEDARVACRQLGFSGAVEATQGATFGSGSGPIYLDDVACGGHENDLMTCVHNGIGVENCGHSEDAGVICGIKVEIRLVGGDTKNEGRLELLHNGEWGTVCDDSWGIDDAQVACRQLGFPSAIEATSRASFGEGVGSIHLDNVECTGSESNLLSCQHNEIGENNCDHSEDAGVVCNPDILRLVGAASSNEGRLEIFLNGEWGTVCDDSWDIEDARVACRQLGFRDAIEATQGGSFGSGSGPIYLDDVACGGHENDLMNCVHNGIGVENCDHIEDAGVICGPTEPCFSGPCAHGASCINLSDGFTCHCPDGYGGVACAEDLTITSTSSIIVAHCATSLDHSDHLMVVSGQQAVYLPGDSVEYDCPDGYHLSGSATRFCQSDLTWSGQPAECNINFCANEPCANGATCFNALDGFTCSCPDGYDGLTCADVAHCVPTSDPSDVLTVVSGQQALYLPGDSVEYDCPDGYHLSGSALRYCQSDFSWSGQQAKCSREPCFSEPCLNGATCTEAPGGFTCLCPTGYGGVTCAEVASCMVSLNESDVLFVASSQQAMYVPGDSVEYACPAGYHLNGSAIRICQPDFSWSGQPAACSQDSCIDEPCANGATCISTPSGFNCLCTAAYDGLTCEHVLAAQDIQRKTSSPVVLIMGGGGGALVFIAVLFVVITVLNRRKSRPQTNFPFHTGLTTEIGCVELSEFTSTTAACAGPPSPIYHETIADAGAADDHLYAEVPRRGLPLPPFPSKIVDEEADGTYCNMKNLF